MCCHNDYIKLDSRKRERENKMLPENKVKILTPRFTLKALKEELW